MGMNVKEERKARHAAVTLAREAEAEVTPEQGTVAHGCYPRYTGG
jgi:hypothetical protein